MGCATVTRDSHWRSEVVMPDEELQPLPREAEEPTAEPETYAIRRVREVVADTRLIQQDLAPSEPEILQKAKIEWQLHVWSGPRKGNSRPLGMAEMGGATQARPHDGARAKK
jgi:hypothetical protein